MTPSNNAHNGSSALAKGSDRERLFFAGARSGVDLLENVFVRAAGVPEAASAGRVLRPAGLSHSVRPTL
jgi:hypothetical protein